MKKLFKTILAATIICCINYTYIMAESWPLAQNVRLCHIIELGHPYSTAKVNLSEKEAKLFGFKYDVFDTQGDIPTQIRLIEDCITRQYDAILIVVYDPSALNAALKEAYDAGIPVIAEGGFPNESGRKWVSTLVGSDGVAEGHAAGNLICDKLKTGQNWVMIEGGPGHPIVAKRSTAKDVTSKRCPGVKLLAVDTGRWNREKARTVMENLLTAHPGKIDLVYCHNDDMCLGAAKAIQERGLKDKILVVGVDGGAGEVYDAIKDGTMYATILNDASFIAVNIVQIARDLIENRPILREYISPAIPITPKTVDNYPRLW